MADQERFATLSGDRNPMHMEPLAAKRTQAGVCVVHGVHAALWILESLARLGIDPASFSRLKVKFTRFVPVHAGLTFQVIKQDEKTLKVEARVDDTPAISLSGSFGTGERRADAAVPDKRIVIGRAPFEPAFADLADSGGWLPPQAGAAQIAAEDFPMLSAAFGAESVAAVAGLSTVVGMAAPGLHSIFSDFTLDIADGAGEPGWLGYRVLKADERFRLVNVSLAAQRFSGELSAYMRFPPVEPPSMETVASTIEPGCFADRVALVIGGSRGIGAVTAKLIAAGGGRVVVSWASGQSEAEKLAAEINAFRGEDVCTTFRYDAAAPSDIPQAGEVTHAYYCATGKIFDQTSGVFAKAKFDAFCAIYVEGFHALVQRLVAARGPKQKLTLLYPSSVAVAERPKGMTEYAMAKAAGELLCVDLARAYANLSVSMPRLPRILTDQTATIPPVEAQDALAVMTPLLRAEGRAPLQN